MVMSDTTHITARLPIVLVSEMKAEAKTEQRSLAFVMIRRLRGNNDQPERVDQGNAGHEKVSGNRKRNRGFVIRHALGELRAYQQYMPPVLRKKYLELLDTLKEVL